jgi:hypothetical protein
MSIKSVKSVKSTKSTTIRITNSTKDVLENLDFVRKHTFDEIMLKLMDVYKKRKNKTVLKEVKIESSDNSTTIRINKSTKGKLENLDFVRKHTFDKILVILIGVYEQNKRWIK